MRVPTHKLIKAAARKRAREGPSEGQRAPAPKRLSVAVPESSPPREPTVAPEIDLTADTPPERVVEEGAPEPGPEAPEEGAASLETEELPVRSGPAPVEAVRSWGEGPSGATSPPPATAPIDSPLVESEGAEAVGGNGVRSRPPRDSILNDGRWAERLLSPVFVPEVMEELSHLKASTFFRESYAALVRIANSLRATREVIHGGKTLIREAQGEAEEARARAEAAEMALESARTARADEIRAAESRLELESNRLRAALRQMSVAENAVAARDLHISELDSAIQSAESRASKAEEWVRGLEERVRETEEKARAAEERAEATEERARVAEEKARASENRAAQAAEEARHALEAKEAAEAALTVGESARAVEVEAAVEARTARVLEEFRVSECFVNEVAEASAEAFLQGFEHGKEKVARDLNLPQALEVEPERLSEVASSEDESAPPAP